MQYIVRLYLPVTVFITGACILALEVVATRILTPYFGNTIFTVSSVISVVLAALSCGYYLGGKLADKHPSRRLFFGIILAGGAGVLVMQGLQELLLPVLGRHLSITSGPLVAAGLLFFAPSFILGMLSPFAIKLADLDRKKQGIGTVVGEMFFFSTMGSIVGSLAAGYVLIPNFSISTIMIGTGCLLFLLGFTALQAMGLRRRQLVKIGLLLFMAVALGSIEVSPANAVYERNGVYEKIIVSDTVENGRPVRHLLQDGNPSGGMYIDTGRPSSEYFDYYALPQVFTQKLDRALVIGGGTYAVPRLLTEQYPAARIDTIEIEPSLVEVGKRYFNLPGAPGLRHHVGDGRRFLTDARGGYDMIFSDVYFSLYATPMHFTTKEFFQTAYSKIADNGIFVANIIDSMQNHEHSVLRSEVATLKQVFPNVYVVAVSGPKQKGPQNFMLIGHKSKQRLNFTAPAVQGSTTPVISGLAAHAVPLSQLDLGGRRVLTDNFAPVDNWSIELLTSKN